MPIKKIPGLSSIEEIEQKIKEEVTVENSPKKNWVRITIFALLVISVILGVLNLFNNQVFTSMKGTGSVDGWVVNSRLTPVPAEIFVLGQEISTKANDLGQFNLSNVPAGNSTIIIAYQGMGIEYQLSLQPGELISIGQVVVEETQMPEETRP